MRVLLIRSLLKASRDPIGFPLGLLSIGTYLRGQNHVVKLEDRALRVGNIKKTMRDFAPDVVGVSVTSAKGLKDAAYVSRLAKKVNAVVVWGGTLPSAIPEVVLKEDYIDMVSIGEGEITIAVLLDALKTKKPLHTVEGLAFKENGTYIRTPDRPFMDPKDWPIIDWTLIDVPKYFVSYHDCKKMSYLYCAKGCPGSCTFCFNKEFHKCTYRKRPMEDVLAEVEYLAKNHGMDGVYFSGEMWCVSKKEMKINCDKIRNSGIDFVWGCFLKVGVLDLEDYEYMYQSGCRWINFGIESGSPEMLKKIKKGISLDDIGQTMKYCAQTNIAAWNNFIIGFPDETPEEIKQTAILAKKISPYAINMCHHYMPVMGSELYYQLLEQGRLKPIKSIKDIKKGYSFDVVGKNYSKVSTRELKVIRSCITWWSFTKNYPNRGKTRFGFMLSAISNLLKTIKIKGMRRAFAAILYPAFEFSGYLFNMIFFPRIKKKYELGMVKNKADEE